MNEQAVRTVEAPYHDAKTTLTNAAVNNAKAKPDTLTEKTAVTENVTESPALDPRTKKTGAYVVTR